MNKSGRLGEEWPINSLEIGVGSLHCRAQNQALFYAWLPHESATGAPERRRQAKERLALTLWDQAAGTSLLPRRAPAPIRLGVDGLGRPRLLGQGARSPVISFSEGGGRLWCALFGDDDYQIGIDVAGASEFPEKYPFHRVFQVEEMRQALRLTGGEEARAAALLWSVKEAAVKAVGCAFHFAGPGEITAYPLPVEAKGEGWRPFEVRLSASALPSFSAPLRQTIRVHSLPQEKLWLSVALLNRRAPAYE